MFKMGFIFDVSLYEESELPFTPSSISSAVAARAINAVSPLKIGDVYI